MNNWNGIASLLIACLELIFIINLLIFSEKNKLNWTIIGIVFLLFGYQAIEYLICGIGLSISFMAYLAFVDITFLPPLNLFFVLMLLKMKRQFLSIIFLPAIFFVIYYSFMIEKFEIVKCTVLYATYNYPLGNLYGFFYYLPLITSFILLSKELKAKSNVVTSISLKILFYSHLSLIIPVAIAFILATLDFTLLRDSIESILCKIAFLYCLGIVYFALNNKQAKL